MSRGATVRDMNMRTVIPPAAWAAKAAAVPATAGPAVLYLWRAATGWLTEICIRFGPPERLACARRLSSRLRLRIGALEALVRCLVLEAARRLAPTLPLQTASERRTPSPDLRGETDKPAAPTSPGGKSRSPEGGTPPHVGDPSTWRVGFAWSAIEAAPPRPAPVFRRRAFASGGSVPVVTPIDLCGETVFLRLGETRQRQEEAVAPPTFAGRFGAGPAPRWRYFPYVMDAGHPNAASVTGKARAALAPWPPAASPRAVWAIAARLEAARRIILDPDPHVRRIALRLIAQHPSAGRPASARRAFLAPPRPLGSARPRLRGLPSDLLDLLADADRAWHGDLAARCDTS